MQEDRKDKLVCLNCSHSGLKYFAQWLYTGTLPTIIPESQHEWESQFLGLTWAYQVGEWMGCVDFQDTVADTMIPLFFDHPPNDVNLPIDTCSLGFPGTQLLVDLIVYGPASCLKDAQGVHFGYKYWQGCDDEDFMDHLASEIAKAEGQDWPEALESRKLGIMLVCGFVEAKVHHDSADSYLSSAHKDIIELDVSSDGFRLFALWLYTGKCDDKHLYNNCWGDSITELLRAHKVGRELGCVDFQDTVVDALMKTLTDCEGSPICDTLGSIWKSSLSRALADNSS
ncbi:hypothetical protein LTR37_006496 [Vermiconidia calcicola]|uniref:Uncharacterized protein n=1 Tax=Vermiconidia calcicola TaxID=1690605 RepID=A0ACC3NHV1_9PEZI|nr:hypothetical protein LTR37_006496 [Vermiconidia calcicola]